MYRDLNKRITAALVGLCVGGVLILSACSGSAQPEAAVQTQQADIQFHESPTPIITSLEPTSQATSTAADDSSLLDGQDEQGNHQISASPMDSSDIEPEPISPLAPKSDLAATDPSSVDLSSGSPQLVEFFAFW